MSFAQDVKNELCGKEMENGQEALAYGMLLFSKTFSAKAVGLQTENENIAVLYRDLVSCLCGVTLEVESGGGKRSLYTAVTRDAGSARKILVRFGHTGKEAFLRVRENGPDREEWPLFVRGAYLSCGHMSDPEKDYHLEFSVGYRYLADDLVRILTESGFPVRRTVRKSNLHIVYLKESEAIEDILIWMGSPKAALRMMDVKIYKEIRNNVNRVNNFETANIVKTATAAAEQIFDIRYVLEKRGEENLPEDLLRVARLRIENPDMSLKELEEVIQPPMTRSSINRRLGKLREMAKTLRTQKGRENID